MRLSAPGCPSGEGKKLGEQEGLRGREKGALVISLPSSDCHHIPLLVKNLQWCPATSKPDSSAWLSRPSTFWPLPRLPYIHPSTQKTRLPALVRLIPAALFKSCHSALPRLNLIISKDNQRLPASDLKHFLEPESPGRLKL